MQTKITIGFSPCPNDTFIFDAMINGKIDTGDISFHPVLEDVETLNKWAMEGKLDVTKLSFPAFFANTHQYQLLNTGSALGEGAGPLMISLPGKNWTAEQINSAMIAIPGLNTTANLLLRFAFPQAENKKPIVFSAIEEAVLSGETDLGVIIHENRFTYAERGLEKVIDLGDYWEKEMKVPVPLGGIAVHQRVDRSIASEVQRLIKASLQFAFSNYPTLSHYVIEHAQAMKDDVMRKHIDLYVNKYSLDLGEEGRNAIMKLSEIYAATPGKTVANASIFLD